MHFSEILFIITQKVSQNNHKFMAEFPSMPSIDVVTSALNEEDCLLEFIQRTEIVLKSLSNYEYRIVIMDNGSQDSTWKIIEKACDENPRISGIKLSRTFSFDAALTCGMDHASADFLVMMASDLQDPPELIPRLIQEIEKGHDQVVVRIRSRDSVPLLRRFLSRKFYRLANWITRGLIPEDVSDFRIMNRKAYSSSRKMRESHRFLRGLNAWIGFSTGYISIDRPNRFAGKSKWLKLSLFSVISHAVTSILAHSSRPLMWISASSLSLSFISFVSLPCLVIFWLIYGVPFTGFGWVMSLAVLSFSIVMLGLGVIALFISLIYEEVKQRPLYLISEIVGKK
jgi:glycosyltransferase involved in cell wall biosynthesis